MPMFKLPALLHLAPHKTENLIFWDNNCVSLKFLRTKRTEEANFRFRSREETESRERTWKRGRLFLLTRESPTAKFRNSMQWCQRKSLFMTSGGIPRSTTKRRRPVQKFQNKFYFFQVSLDAPSSRAVRMYHLDIIPNRGKLLFCDIWGRVR